jgi:hypothetical protein
VEPTGWSPRVEPTGGTLRVEPTGWNPQGGTHRVEPARKSKNTVFNRYFPMTESARNAPKRDMMKLNMVKTWKMTEAKSSAARTSYR